MSYIYGVESDREVGLMEVLALSVVVLAMVCAAISLGRDERYVCTEGARQTEALLNRGWIHDQDKCTPPRIHCYLNPRFRRGDNE